MGALRSTAEPHHVGTKFHHYFGLSGNSAAKQFYRVRAIETALDRGRARVGYFVCGISLAQVSTSADNCLTTPCRRRMLGANDLGQNRRTLS